MGLLPMDLDILPPSDDRVFKLIMTSPEAKTGLMKLISAIIGRTVVDVVLYPNEPPSGDMDEKAECLDINCKIDDDSQVNLEMQAHHIQEDLDGQHRNLKGKSVYYLTDLHSSQPAKGLRRYDKLARTYQITFCSYTVFPEYSEYVNSFSLRHDTKGDLLCDAIQVVFVELSKLKELLEKPVSEMSMLDKWALFLRYAPDSRHRETVNKVIESEEVLQMAGELLMSISQNEMERAIFRSRRKYQTDRASDLATAEDNGRQIGEKIGKEIGEKIGKEIGKKIGKEIGKTERNMEIARKMLSIGEPVDKIMLITDLTRREIENLHTASEKN